MKNLNNFMQQVQLTSKSTLILSILNAAFVVFSITYVFLTTYPWIVSLEQLQHYEFFTIAPITTWPFTFSLSYILLLFIGYNILFFSTFYWMIRDTTEPKIKRPSFSIWFRLLNRFNLNGQGYAIASDALFGIVCLENCSFRTAQDHLRQYAEKALALRLPAPPTSTFFSKNSAISIIFSILLGVGISVMIRSYLPIQTLVSYQGFVYSWLPSLVLFDIVLFCIFTAKWIDRKMQMKTFLTAYSTLFKDRLDFKPNALS